MGFIKVANDEYDEVVELPLENDGTLLLSTLNTMFPSSTGLKYKASMNSDAFRGLRLSEGRLYPPPDTTFDTWNESVFYCVYPKEMKRKVDEEEALSPGIQNKKVDRKRSSDLIVLGMAWKTTEETMREYFARYGELAMAQLKRDPSTNQSKGYGFIRFTDYGAQVTCLSERHYIDGRWVDVKIPNSKVEADRQEVNLKIYVGNLPDGVTPEALKAFFNLYGAVAEVTIPKPFRNFAFVTFCEPDTPQSLLGKQIPYEQNILNISSVVPRIQYNRSNNQMNVSNGKQPVSPFSIGNQGSVDQNTTALAALTMLNNPSLFNAMINLAAASQGNNPSARTNSNFPGRYSGQSPSGQQNRGSSRY